MKKKITKKQQKRLMDAAENLREIQEMLAPYADIRHTIVEPKRSTWGRTSAAINGSPNDDFTAVIKKAARPLEGQYAPRE